jgi:hypothetical protein
MAHRIWGGGKKVDNSDNLQEKYNFALEVLRQWAIFAALKPRDEMVISCNLSLTLKAIEEQTGEDVWGQKVELLLQEKLDLAFENEALERENAKLKQELAGRPMAKCSTVGCESTTDGNQYWFCPRCAKIRK